MAWALTLWCSSPSSCRHSAAALLNSRTTVTDGDERGACAALRRRSLRASAESGSLGAALSAPSAGQISDSGSAGRMRREKRPSSCMRETSSCTMASLDWKRTQPTQQASSVGTVARSGGSRHEGIAAACGTVRTPAAAANSARSKFGRVILAARL
eukprot:scaffold70227_cov61-Phaeocystis_antarctica.AAC.2